VTEDAGALPYRRGAVRLVLLLSAALVVGCGGGLPLLHPAQTLGPGEVRASAGFSANVASGDFADALRSAISDAAANPSPPGPRGADAVQARGALVAASVAPGLAPLVAARVGVGRRTEAGLAYTGRATRADVRRSFDLSRHWSLSLGAGGTAVLYGRQAGGALPNVDLGQLRGWGADVPLLVGYASDGDLYLLWVGARGGWEHVEVSQLLSQPSAPPALAPPTTLSVTRFWGGGILGLAVGFRHVHVAMEIDVSYATITGDDGGRRTQVAGVALAPAGCAWWDF
jgi:hypothetical protein